jgi:hypothetical protein
MVPEMICRTDSGKHQQLRRRDGAGTQDDLPPLGIQNFFFVTDVDVRLWQGF